jgi:parvulin-like peptidyl-prolyl isomerase
MRNQEIPFLEGGPCLFRVLFFNIIMRLFFLIQIRTNLPTTMSKAEAIAELEEIKSRITPENFQDFAKERSDCGSFASGGDLGTFGRGDMMAPFEDATYALDIGEISDIVDTDSGVHLIMRYA